MSTSVQILSLLAMPILSFSTSTPEMKYSTYSNNDIHYFTNKNTYNTLTLPNKTSYSYLNYINPYNFNTYASYCNVENDTLNTKLINEFIKNVISDNIELIAKKVRYPLRRPHPIPNIMNEEEFIERYYEIFDEHLIDMIYESNTETAWGAVGWRGMMFNRGEIWLDYSGNLIAVNYLSNYEKHLRNTLIDKDKKSVHSSIQNFDENVLVMQTESHRIRIDKIGDSFRYTSWKASQQINEEPGDIILNGKLIHEGNAGNHRYEFTQNESLYVVSIQVIGKDDKYGDLYIYTGNAKTLYDVYGDNGSELLLEQEILFLSR